MCMFGDRHGFACVWEGAQGRAPGRVGVDGCKVMEGRGGGLGCLPSRMAVLIESLLIILNRYYCKHGFLGLK